MYFDYNIVVYQTKYQQIKKNANKYLNNNKN